MSQIIDNLPDLAQIFGSDTETLVNYAQRHFRSLRRQYEWLTVRALLRHALGPDARIAYDSNGKPWVSTSNFRTFELSNFQISISHSKTHAALLLPKFRTFELSNFRICIGVDIEQISPRILTLGHRIAQPCELPPDFATWPQDKQAETLTTLWTIKEAVYKSLPTQQGIDLLTDIVIPNLRGTVHTLRIADNVVTVFENPR